MLLQFRNWRWSAEETEFQEFHLPICDLEWLMWPPPLLSTKLRHRISLSSWIIPKRRGSRHWMRLTGDTQQMPVLFLREFMWIFSTTSAISTSVTDQAQSYESLRMGSPYMDWFSSLYHPSSSQTALHTLPQCPSQSWQILSVTNVTLHNTKFLKHLSCSGLNASSIPI